jgi:hypothetical protein
MGIAIIAITEYFELTVRYGFWQSEKKRLETQRMGVLRPLAGYTRTLGDQSICWRTAGCRYWGIYRRRWMIYIDPRWGGGRPQCPRGLRHELYSPARTLGSWVRIPCLSTFILYVLSCAGSGLLTGWSPVQGDLPSVCKIKKLKWNEVFHGWSMIQRKQQEYEWMNNKTIQNRPWRRRDIGKPERRCSVENWDSESPGDKDRVIQIQFRSWRYWRVEAYFKMSRI